MMAFIAIGCLDVEASALVSHIPTYLQVPSRIQQLSSLL